VAGRELQVDAVLEGNYQRSEDRLRLTVQMLRSVDGSPLWAESFMAEVEDIFDVQDRIADRVVGALQKKLSDEAKAKLTKRYTENVEAYEEYLKGRFYYNKRTTEGYDVALACFEKAIEIDPSVCAWRMRAWLTSTICFRFMTGLLRVNISRRQRRRH
jgi:tetratricopeptide (TPR) repeat protein